MDSFTLEVRRSDGKKASYDLPYRKGMTVLDALVEVREKQDSSLAFRHSCRMGICGSCGMNVQGLPRLACQTQVSSLGGAKVRVEPLHGMRIIRDLVVDIDPFTAMHTFVKPYLVRRDQRERDHADREYRVLSEEVGRFLQFDYCIMCALCYSACPTVALDPFYLGPQAITQAYRYMADPRDEGWAERIEALDEAHGVWRCHVAGSCSFVCPKDVDPAKAIQMARMEVLKMRVLRRKPKAGSPLVSPVAAGPGKQGTKAPPFDYKEGGK
jgi:succinate dehydrogenase / fumarate reductase iron-sulfur subunit